MEKYKESDRELLLLLLELQERTAPIEMSIGYISDGGHVCMGIVLHKAPPLAVEALIRKGYVCDLVSRGDACIQAMTRGG